MSILSFYLQPNLGIRNHLCRCIEPGHSNYDQELANDPMTQFPITLPSGILPQLGRSSVRPWHLLFRSSSSDQVERISRIDSGPTQRLVPGKDPFPIHQSPHKRIRLSSLPQRARSGD